MGKNVIVGQSGGPTAVINSSLAGVYQTAKSLGAGMVYGMQYGIEGLLKAQVIPLDAVLKTSMDIELLKRTPASYLGSCRYKLPDADKDPEVYRRLFHTFDRLDIGACFYIGGNDSMDTIAKLSAWGEKAGSPIRFIGVPKTIDNDLELTDHTPGFGSAAKYIATILKEIIRDSTVYDLRSVTVVEIMGRNAGWLTGAACLAAGDDCDGADMVLLPEVPLDPEDFLAKVDELQKNKPSVIIAVSEGVKLADGRYVCELVSEAKTDAFGHKAALSGTGRYLADLISHRLGCKARAIEFSTLQRCAAHVASRTDITEAYQAGGAAVKAAFEGQTGKMAAFRRLSETPYQCVVEMVDVQAVANREKAVPRHWITPDGYQVTEDFVRYARPLIQAELTPIYIDGTPRHICLKAD
ncbi:6-phosphofructokinase [Anaerofilum sp. An201]|nr:6-phosphofructokinase [Anaerofilum sp. An201]OUP03468.1 6-phosphofructokinase [Anaerofilum sp. An201]